MLGKWIKARFASRRGAPKRPPRPAEGAPGRSTVRRPRPGTTPPSTPPATTGTSGAETQLRAQFDARVELLRPHLLREAGRSDIADFLRLLRDPPGGVIRHPPVAAQAVLAVFRRRTFGMAEVTRLIERDPALVQSLLRHANSAFYATSGSQAVSAVGPAVQRIGTNGVYAVVMSSIIEGQLSRPGPEYAAMARQVWEHMVRVAPLAQSIARSFAADAEEAYTLGLLHDVGKLVFFDHVSDLRRRRRRPVRVPKAFMDEALALLHEPLGGLACLDWGLPARFALAVADHHRRGSHSVAVPGSAVVFVAERMDLAAVRGECLDAEGLRSEGGLDISVDALSALLAPAVQRADQSADTLRKAPA